MPRLDENPLRKNCEAHSSEECLWDFGRKDDKTKGNE